jgi:hypothetical protein
MAWFGAERVLSPGLIVAAAALVAATTGTALAGDPGATSAAINKKKVKRIAKKQINRLAPGLSVAHAADADALRGQGLAAFLRYNAAIPSGVTIRGALGDLDTDTGGSPTLDQEVSFPLPAPADLTNAAVSFAPGPAGSPSDEDPACTGSSGMPTAPRGKVCIYPVGFSGTPNTGAGFALGSGGLSRLGFQYSLTGSAGRAELEGSWAYRAP